LYQTWCSILTLQINVSSFWMWVRKASTFLIECCVLIFISFRYIRRRIFHNRLHKTNEFNPCSFHQARSSEQPQVAETRVGVISRRSESNENTRTHSCYQVKMCILVRISCILCLQTFITDVPWFYPTGFRDFHWPRSNKDRCSLKLFGGVSRHVYHAFYPFVFISLMYIQHRAVACAASGLCVMHLLTLLCYLPIVP
jgi:hypothetical protein